jgi:hypothetical protein
LEGAYVVRGIEDDEEVLFYDTGRTTQALLQALVSAVSGSVFEFKSLLHVGLSNG